MSEDYDGRKTIEELTTKQKCGIDPVVKKKRGRPSKKKVYEYMIIEYPSSNDLSRHMNKWGQDGWKVHTLQHYSSGPAGYYMVTYEREK